MSRANLYGYRHSWVGHKEFRGTPSLPTSIWCIAKNYPSSPTDPKPSGNPIIFSKAITSLIAIDEPILLNGRDDVHYETELALLIGKPLHVSIDGHDPLECCRSVIGLGVALDLTLKTLQNELKASGSPWELAKAFDRGCPLSLFVPAEPNWWEVDREVSLTIDGKTVQKQSTADMFYKVGDILRFITRSVSLSPGDIVLTGTPMPTRALRSGEELVATVEGVGSFKTRVC